MLPYIIMDVPIYEYIGGIKYIGGYHECIGERDIMNTLGDVQYIGGYHDACGGYDEYIGGYHEYIGVFNRN